ncbi:MAG TPA: formate dehydrogenase subunit gamma [Herminiimonas sp.]|jgi:formate dehydrogenase subunit gamma|nr:formate dehydrogenase subunit gamma [Herminiimonas sp.]
MSTHVDSHAPFDVAAVESIIAQRKAMPGALLPILHDIQSAVGYIPPSAVPSIADGLNISRAEVHGVITYYHFFRQHPAGKHVVQICRAEACQARGCESLVDHAKALLGCDFHGTTDDGNFSLETVYCLGQCASGPAIQIDDDLYARVSHEKFNRLIQAKRGVQ